MILSYNIIVRNGREDFKMMEYRHMALNISDYNNDTEFWKDVSDIMRILTKQNYDVLFRYEDCGIYIIEYAISPSMEYSDERFELITQDEYEKLINYRNHDCEES